MFTKNQIPRFIAAFSAPETEEGIYWIDLSSDPTGKIIRTHNGVEWVIIGRTGEDIDLSKFVVDANYVHSDFNFNQAYKAAIDAIPTYVSNRLSGYVSDPNYRHIDNNYTNEEKAKLANIEAGAQANDTNTVIDGNYVHTDYNFSSWYKAQVDKMPELSASNDLKADKIPAKPDIIWSPRVVDIPAGRVLSFNTNLKPAIFPDNITNYPAIRAFKVDYNGEDYVYFGLYRQSAQDVSHLGLFRVDGNTINVIRDLYNEVDGWRSNQWLVKDVITPNQIIIGNSTDNYHFFENDNIVVDPSPELNLIDVEDMTVRGLSDLSQAKLNREEYNRLSKAFLTKRDVIDSYLVGGHDLPASAEVAKQLWTKIDVLQSLGQVVGSVDTFAELPGTLTDAYNLWNIKAITTNDFAIVIVDENHEGASSRYSLIVDDHDIITWVFSGVYNSIQRNFTTNPIGNDEIATGAITNSKIANLTIEGNKIKDYTIHGDKIQDGAIDGNRLAHDAVSYEHLNDTVTDVIDDIKDKHTLLNQEFNQHVQDQYNPHVVTKAQVGLGLADNTSDKDKPLSDASLEEFVEVRNELATEQARAEEQENLRIKKDSIQRSNITDKRTVVTAIHPQEITSGSVELIAHNSDVDDVDAWFETKMYLYATEHLFFEAADDGIIIKSDVEAVKATLQSELATAVATIEAEMATMNADFTSELATLGTDIRSEMATMEAELKSEIATLDAELSTEIATLAADIRSEIATLDAELSTEIATLATDIRSEMATLGADIRSEMATMEAELSTELATLEADLTAAIATEQARAEEQEELMIKKATIQRSNVTNKRTVVTAIHPQEITSDKVEFIAHNSDVENADSWFETKLNVYAKENLYFEAAADGIILKADTSGILGEFQSEMASTIADIGTQIAEIGTQITEIGTDIANQSDEIDVLRTRLGVIESLGQVIGSVDTKADLPVNVDDAKSLFKIHGITTNDFAIVITDEDNDGASTRYEVVVDDLGVLTWVYAGAYSSAVPTAIPNPSALTIEQGTLSTIYDGSTQQTVTIPAAPTKLPSPYSVYFLTLDQSNGIPVDVPYDGSIDRFIAWRKLSFINEKGTEIASYRPTYILNHTSEDRWDPVKITLPSSATIPTALPNPNSLTLGDYTYDGSAAVSATFPPIPTRLPCQYPLSIFNVQYSETSVDILNMFYYGNTSHGISGRLLQFYDSDGNLLGQYWPIYDKIDSTSPNFSPMDIIIPTGSNSVNVGLWKQSGSVYYNGSNQCMCTFRIKDLAGHDVSANYISSNTPMWKITLQSANGYGEWAGTFNDSGNTSWIQQIIAGGDNATNNNGTCTYSNNVVSFTVNWNAMCTAYIEIYDL